MIAKYIGEHWKTNWGLGDLWFSHSALFHNFFSLFWEICEIIKSPVAPTN